MKIALRLLLLGLALQSIAFAQSGPTSTAAPAMTTTVSVRHISVESHSDYAATIAKLEKQLGAFDPAAANALAEPNPPVEEIRAKLKAMEGTSGFMRFGRVQSFGDLQPLVGQPNGHARQYVIGNPLIAVQMTQYNPGAGLYVPLRVLIHEDPDGKTRLEYDLPSSLLDQFHDPRISEVAHMLDQKLATLIATAGGL
jgi:uncharacterized protein (DUF302 family)